VKNNELLIPRSTLVNSLINIQIYDGTLKIYNLANRSINVSEKAYDSLYSMNGITKESLKYSYIYYTETEEIESIYDEVLDSLNVLKSIYENDFKKEMKMDKEKK